MWVYLVGCVRTYVRPIIIIILAKNLVRVVEKSQIAMFPLAWRRTASLSRSLKLSYGQVCLVVNSVCYRNESLWFLSSS